MASCEFRGSTNGSTCHSLRTTNLRNVGIMRTLEKADRWNSPPESWMFYVMSFNFVTSIAFGGEY